MAPRIANPSYKFLNPGALAVSGNYLWVANESTGSYCKSALCGSLTQIDATTGAFIQNISDPSYYFNSPCALAVAGSYLWVANFYGNSLTQIDATTGALVQVLKAAKYGFDAPAALAVSGNNLWVANYQGNVQSNAPFGTLTEINATTGAFIQNVGPQKVYGFKGPSSLAFSGSNLWVSNDTGNSLTVVNTSNGNARVFSSSSYGFKYPMAVAASSTGLVAAVNEYGNSLTVVNGSTGALKRIVTGSSYKFYYPTALILAGTNAWVANGGPSTPGGWTSSSLTEINASTGATVRVISDSSYGFNWASALAVVGPNIVVANNQGNSLTVINGSTGALVQILSN